MRKLNKNTQWNMILAYKIYRIVNFQIDRVLKENSVDFDKS